MIGALIITVPHAPTVAPTRNSATTSTTLKIDYTALTGTATGGDSILSYQLEWDNNSNGVNWTPLTGLSPHSLSTSFIQSVTAGNIYKFRYRALNS